MPSATVRPLLRLYELTGDILSLGRFHPVSDRSPLSDKLHRRHSGGRCVPFGDGFLGVSIVLPHRSALVADDPFALTPPQVLNRCVRGILTGLKSCGIPAFYPGLDWVTVDRRIIGMISFDVSADGSLLFEALLCRTRDFSHSPRLPSAGPKPAALEAHEVTSLAREMGVEPTHLEVASLLARGYAAELGLSFDERNAPPASLKEEIEHRIDDLYGTDLWLTSRCVRSSMDRHGRSGSKMGSFEAHCSVSPGGVLQEVLLGGDIIANPIGIEDLERRLRGCPAERSAIDAIVSDVFLQPQNFLLGPPSTSSVAATICAALEAGRADE